MKKMWVLKDQVWEVGCQCCGRLVGESDCFWCAIDVMWRHIILHRRGVLSDASD